MVSTSSPLAVVIWILTLAAWFSRSKAAVCVPLAATPRVLPSVSTVRPIMEVPCSTCMAENWLDMEAMVWFSC